MTVIVTATFHPAPDKREDLVAALRETIPAVHDEEGCLLYAIHDASDATIVMIEKWVSAESLARHAAGAAVAALDAAVTPYIAAPTTVITMNPIPVGEGHKGAL